MVIQVTTEVLEDADAYFANRLNSQAWTSASESDQLAALTTSANLLAAAEWRGRPLNPLYAFPRYLPENPHIAVTPNQLLWALYEQAIHLLANPGLLIETETVDSLVVGPIRLQKLGQVPLIPKIVKRYISPYTTGGQLGGNVWWRAN